MRLYHNNHNYLFLTTLPDALIKPQSLLQQNTRSSSPFERINSTEVFMALYQFLGHATPPQHLHSPMETQLFPTSGMSYKSFLKSAYLPLPSMTGATQASCITCSAPSDRTESPSVTGTTLYYLKSASTCGPPSHALSTLTRRPFSLRRVVLLTRLLPCASQDCGLRRRPQARLH